MDQKTHDKGLEIRKAVLGEAYVNNALKNSDSFNKPFQELVTEYCWGAVWGREELPRKTRSMLNLAMISILNRPHELKAHIKGALTNGVSRDEIREIFMQVSIYAGIPARRRQLPHRARGVRRTRQQGVRHCCLTAVVLAKARTYNHRPWWWEHAGAPAEHSNQARW
ncbi:alkylhydroperoxidase/carboxymuconolactone decarboxylase family protein YurZ [Bradyrhizobium elkanii]